MKLKAEGKVIYEVYPNGGMFDICEADTEKNATLFAAAPEMLKVLEHIAVDFCADSPADYVRLVNDAIKKAKGE